MGSHVTSVLLSRIQAILVQSGASSNPSHPTEACSLRKIRDPCVFVAFCCMIAQHEVKALLSICGAVTPGRSHDEIPPAG